MNDLFKEYFPILKELEGLMDKSSTPLIIAIDGRCGSGKSTLSSIISQVYDCNIVHMDDFFLPFHMKTRERLEQPGGNIHYERFNHEIGKYLKSQSPITYQPYLCSSGNYGTPIHLDSKPLIIIEGVYSLHPTIQNIYDYKIFLTLDRKLQQTRILERDGLAKLSKFINEWIPLEEKYFLAFNIEEKCDLVFDSSILEKG